jgi:hypothetical protein
VPVANAPKLISRREKARIPAWCDRVVRKGDNLQPLSYDAAPLLFSDHRPVYATFLCTINVIDDALKESLSLEMYNRRRIEVGDNTANTRKSDVDDEDLMGYDAIAPGLPPASSDKRRWWLANGEKHLVQPIDPDQRSQFHSQSTSALTSTS